MLWEHEPQASVSTAFSNSPKLLRVFPSLDRNTEYMFSLSFRQNNDEKKENNLVTSLRQQLVLVGFFTNQRAYFLRTVFLSVIVSSQTAMPCLLFIYLFIIYYNFSKGEYMGGMEIE